MGEQRELPAAVTFEELFRELQEATDRLETGKLGLEESIALYEECAAIVERLRTLLDDAEVRVEAVQKRLEGGQGGG